MAKLISTYEEIISAALALPPSARAMLAEHLMESLDAEDQENIDALWAVEAARRDRELEDGTVTAIPGEEVLKRLQSRTVCTSRHVNPDNHVNSVK
jgi:putative addiction module component (TIGR02574 family)